MEVFQLSLLLTNSVLGIVFSAIDEMFFMRERKNNERKTVNSKPPRSERNPEFETPSQRRNRDGIGRGPSGSDGGSTKARGSNH